MAQGTEIKLFGEQKIRTNWDEEQEEWYFSVVDVIETLTGSANPRDYRFKMTQRVKLEDGIELSTICRQLKMLAPKNLFGGDMQKYYLCGRIVRPTFKLSDI
jgi:hypothetical protein